jgi:hypothetical protein
MRRTIEIAQGEAASVFAVRKLSRATLYGSKRRAAIDAQGRECEPAALTQDGRFVLPRGGTALVYLDENGDAVERSELVSHGSLTDALKQKDGLPFACTPATPRDILACTATRIYRLDTVSISRTLDAALRETGVLRLRQAQEDADEHERAFLVRNDAGHFLLLGERNGFDFVGPDEPDLSMADDEMDDDLDLAMW